MAQMNKKMITLCTAAIGAIYVTGIAAADTIAVQAPQSTKEFQLGQGATKKAYTYKDGTYTGVGENRIGAVEVAVSIKSDVITSVEITNSTTSYSVSYIQHLPNEVLVRQSSDVDVVSGATLSTEDFQNAVDDALQQAKQA
ncbi:FMN-binding protein [Bacillus sp. 03113]|uniref:FMN-binding protein n=1 Tax=Bacillus sp. 03113 TaxID=2578211 RepID=UPI0011445ADD|nr:FMN-binding protein [Bacillus sp. 03113]